MAAQLVDDRVAVRSVYEKESEVRGHHIYKASWMPSIGEEHSFFSSRWLDERAHVVIIDCRRYHNVYDPALIQDPASNTVCYRYTPGL